MPIIFVDSLSICWHDNNKGKYMLIDKPSLQFKQNKHTTYVGDSLQFLKTLPEDPIFNLIFTSPPYNLGKTYEDKVEIGEYLKLIIPILEESFKRLAPDGSLILQVGNYITSGKTRVPLDYIFFPCLSQLGFIFQQRIIWHYRHGLHGKNRFDGRHEAAMWFTKSEDYKFNIDPVRVPQLYPNYKNKGVKTANPMGKNPSDTWEMEAPELMTADFIDNIPNVKKNHCEKVDLVNPVSADETHPCQFPVGLAERFILSMTDKGDVVFDPFAGVGSCGVAAVMNERIYLGCDLIERYGLTADQRIEDHLQGKRKYRPHNAKIPDPANSSCGPNPKPKKSDHKQAQKPSSASFDWSSIQINLNDLVK